ncbi:hypothetical protein [Acidisphaera sp. L21]|jgi:hypothetical protein|uniref:hypothetical protein n=1 Tax=Acidisphaera sp. L21 TaxID=1641851 RepID=UPI00131DC3B9|nr:hypothetical protein [Acidisphaera sp. L21]
MNMRPLLFALFCLIVLGGFTYTKYEGMALFGSGLASKSGQTGASGGHGGGFLLGAHK